MRELRVEDALLYLDQVKVEFGDRPHIYNEFLDIMKTFKTQQIDTPGVIQRVSNLFQGNKKLVLGFNTFLPEGYKIELPLDGDGPPVAVFHGIGGTVTHILSNPPQRVETAAGAGAPQPAGALVGSRLDGGGSQPEIHLGKPGIHHHPQQAATVAAAAAMAGQASMLGQPSAPSNAEHQSGTAAPGGYGRLQMQPHAQPPSHMRGHQMMVEQTVRLDAQHRAVAGGPLQHARGIPGRQASVPGVVEHTPVGLDGSFSASFGLGGTAQRQPSVLGAQPGAAAVSQGIPSAVTGSAAAQPHGGQQVPLEFDHAINYVTTIKKRFSNEPETYKKFLEILHTYQKDQRGIKEVLDEVSVLFEDHPDLLKEFTYFLPEGVQAQAKAQLDQAAKESEARKAARASQEAITKMAGGMRRTEVGIHGGQPMPSPYPPGQQSATPFGATQGRLPEREIKIQNSAHYGVVSFASTYPPKRGGLTPSQAAASLGRPTNIPQLPKHPNTTESAFFQRVKEHLNRRELAPDKPSISRRHTPYTEFLKCLHLFGAGIVSKAELVILLKGLFMHGHAPKTGANAGGGVSNPSVASDAHSLLLEFEDILIGRGPYAEQETIFKDKSKYGSLRTRDFDYSSCEKPTPSYRSYPADYPLSLFITNPGESEQDAAILNSEVVCVGVERSSRKHMTSSPEDYDAIRIRRNAYDDIMFRVEDERYEVDMAIERNAMAMRQIEPYADEVSILRQNEEKDGQPIGRLQYQLKKYAINTISVNAIGRIYGENGDEVLQHLARNPLVVLPTVYARLRQKDSEWRKAKQTLRERWGILNEENYEGSLDYLSYFYRKEIERSFTAHNLVDECKRAKHFSKHPEKVKDHPAIRPFIPEFSRKNSDADALLFQPYIVVKMGQSASLSHHDAFKMITTKIKSNSAYTKAEREAVGRIWAEFMLPWFGFQAHLILDELREGFGGKVSAHVVKYAPGQIVRTAFGDGRILSFLEGNPSMGCRYKVRLPFGVASVRPYAILHALPQSDGVLMVRRDGVMTKDDRPDEAGEGIFAEKLNKKFELMFATESVYVFMRVYCLLVSLLNNTREHVATVGPTKDPRDSYCVPAPVEEVREKRPRPIADFPGAILMLTEVVSRKVEMKEYETYCRRVCKSKVHQMVVLPKLIDKCTDALLNVAKEDALLPLFDYCLHREMDPVQLRSLCFSVTPDASYRIQYDNSTGHMFFAFLPGGERLFTVPQDEGSMQEDDEEDEMKDAEETLGTNDNDCDGDGDDYDANKASPPSKKAKLT